MKNNTKKVLIVLLVVVMALSFTACGKQKPDAAIDEAIKAVQKLDEEKMVLYYGSSLTDEISEDEMFTQDVLNALVKNLTYKVISVEEKDGTAVAKVEFTNVDMNAAISEFFTQAFTYALSFMSLPEDQIPSDAELNAKFAEMLTNILNADGVAMTTKTAEVNMTYNEDKKVWTINNDDSAQDFVNAMFGGLLEVDTSTF